MKLLEVQDLSIGLRGRSKRTDLVKGISFTLDRGGILGLVGESGAGKTLTAYALSGLLPHPLCVTGGRIVLHGKEIMPNDSKAWLDNRGNRVFVLFQSPSSALDPTAKIGDQIAEVLVAMRNHTWSHARLLAESLLEMVGVPGYRAGSYPFQLSGGMRQRVLICMALAIEPEILIADEPFSGLDALRQGEILQLIGGLIKNRGTALIFISHDLRTVSSFAHRVAVLHNGRMVEEDSIRKLLEKPEHPYTRTMVESLVIMEKSLGRAAAQT